MVINDLVIEVTRRCNMSCDHCLRGEQQNIDLDTSYVSKLFDQVNYLRTITFTGGEPSLVPHIISKIIDIAKEKNVVIGRFYIVTNAKIVTTEFMEVLLKCFLYCTEIDDEIKCLSISNDIHHGALEDIQENVRKLLAFRFAEKRHEEDYYNYYDENTMINEGNASLNYGGRPIEPNEVFIQDDYIEDQIYLNCKGNLIPCCDFSYETQNESNVIIGNVNEPCFNLQQAIETYNEQYELCTD